MMNKFILVSFGFMAWAFYEMSGGSDFDPEAIKTARIAELEEERIAKGLPKPEPVVAEPAAVVVAEAPKVIVDTDPPLDDAGVTRVALNLTTLESVIDTAESTGSTPAAQSGFVVTQENVPQNVSLVTSSADTPAIIPSLIAPNDASADNGATLVPVGTTASAQDIRSVTGNRVNVRGGPGTGFSVVAKLVRGDEIRVLEDNGDGWVRFETVDGSTGGWLADFLLTGG